MDYEAQIIQHMIDELEKVDLGRMKDLPSDILNFDERSFIPFSHSAEQWLKDGPEVFGAIKLIVWHDEFIETDVNWFDPSSVVDRFVEVVGEELLMRCETYLEGFSDYHNVIVTEEVRQALIRELKELIKNTVKVN